MKNMKKVLSVLLAFAMVLSMGLSSFAFEDVKDGTKVSEAVGILNNLGIIEGFEDGTFRPGESVTRAQMAAIICRTLGYDDQAQGSAGTTVFSDVAASHWASGYINVAQSLGIINGYGNGCYGPEDKVTYEQAVKMIVVALGYELDAQAKGGWSTGYLAVASREGITKNSGGSVGAPAERGTIAVLVYNSLEVRLMDQQTWTTNGGDEYGKTDETILTQYLDVQKWEGIVSSVPYYEFAQEGYEEDKEQLLTLEDAFYTEYENGKLQKRSDYLEAVDCSLVEDVNTLVGKKVVAYIGVDEDDETGNRMVYAVAEKQGANTVTKISATQLVESGDRDYSKKDVIAYRNVGSTKINTIDLDEDVEVIVNYGAGTRKSVSNTSDLEEIFEDASGTIELISNDSNSKIDYIIATVYSEEAVIEEVNVEDEMITFTTYSGTLEDIDTEDEDTLVVVIRDGEVASVEDIEEQDTVSIVGSDDFADSFRVLYVSSKVVSGSVGSYYDDIVEINNDEYEISPFYGVSASDLSGEEGIFFLNVDGQIAWADSSSQSHGNYALVLAAGTTSGISSGYEVEVALADGTIAQYGLNSKAYIEDVDGTNSAKSDSATYDALKVGMTASGTSAYRITAENIKNHVYEISVKNGKITKLKKVDKGSSASGKDYDEENMSYGAISFDEATVVFSIEVSGSTQVEGDDVSVGRVWDFLVDGEGDDSSLIAFDENTRDIAGLVIGFGLSTSVPQDGDAFIITSVKNSEVNDYDAYVVTGMQGGKLVTYTICDEDDGYTGDESDLKKGNVILLGVENSNGVVSDFETLYSVTEGIKTTDNKSDEIYYVAGNLDEDNEPTNNKFYLMNNSNLEGSYYDAENGISMRNSANYTLVDYSESKKNPEVTKKTKSKSIFGTLSKYDSVVFVRYYDDELCEVVVYRYNNGDIDIPSVKKPEPVTVAKPTATPDSGEVAKSSTVTLAAGTGAVIYYTTNGEAPTTESTVYSEPISITENVTIKAIAVLDGTESAVATFEYTVPVETTGLMVSNPAAVGEKKAEIAASFAEKKVEITTPVVTEVTKAETPAAATAPAAEKAKIETPAAAPATEAAKSETPAATTPAAEPSKTETPAAAPATEKAKTEAPAAAKVDSSVKAAVKADLTATKSALAKLEIKKVEAAAAVKPGAAKATKAPAAVITGAAALVKTNINKATAAELAKLEGVTDALAAKIVEYRTKNGDFKTIEDVKKVDGITDTVYNSIKDKITV